MQRRNAIAAVSAAFVPLSQLSGQSQGPKFFTAADYALLGELCDLLIPADETSPAAGAAGVPWYIDRVIAQSGADTKALWKAGLQTVRSHGSSERALAAISTNEANPVTEAERFFAALKSLCVEAYLYSEGGRKYLGYKGSRAIGAFPGCELTTIPEKPGRGRV